MKYSSYCYCVFQVRKRARSQCDRPENDWKVHVCSENNFPTAAGLASSAAGYACFGEFESFYFLTFLQIVKIRHIGIKSDFIWFAVSSLYQSLILDCPGELILFFLWAQNMAYFYLVSLAS